MWAPLADYCCLPDTDVQLSLEHCSHEEADRHDWSPASLPSHGVLTSTLQGMRYGRACGLQLHSQQGIIQQTRYPCPLAPWQSMMSSQRLLQLDFVRYAFLQVARCIWSCFRHVHALFHAVQHDSIHHVVLLHCRCAPGFTMQLQGLH